MFANRGRSVKFTVEIYATADDGSETLLDRNAVSAIAPLGTRRDARDMLATWKSRGAKSARILNTRAETVYKISE